MSPTRFPQPRLTQDSLPYAQTEMTLSGKSDEIHTHRAPALELPKCPATIRHISVNDNSINPNTLTARSEIASKFELHPVLAHVFATRGHKADASMHQHLNPSIEMYIPQLSQIGGFDRACELHAEAIVARAPTYLFGDYDVDGITSVVQPYLLQKHFGLDPKVGFPHRLNEGYDLKTHHVEALRGKDPGLLMAYDLGTFAHVPILLAKALGWQTVVTDHHECRHLPENPVHPADAFCTPKLGEFKGGQPSAGVLSWLENYVTWQKLSNSSDRQVRRLAGKFDPFERLDLAALSAIADQMPCTDINRAIIKEGLPRIARTSLRGLAELDETIGARDGSMVDRAGFYLAPAINAASRMSEADIAFRQLVETDKYRANDGAHGLIKLNDERKVVERADFLKALELIDRLPRIPDGLLLAGDFYLGTVGIVASRVVAHLQISAALVAPAVRVYEGHEPGSVFAGSGRTTDGRNLLGSLEPIREHLIQLGGHAPAVGLALHRDKISVAQELFSQIAGHETRSKFIVPQVVADIETTLNEIDSAKLLADIHKCEPWGRGNPSPTFLIRGLTVCSPPETSPQGHIGFHVGSGVNAMPAKLWHQAGSPEFNYGQQVDLACQLDGDSNRRYLKVLVVDPKTN